jgi:hypothetical protein
MDATSRRPRSRSPDQWLMSSLIPLSYPAFNPCGLFSRRVIFLPTFPLLSCVIAPLSLTRPHGLFPISSSIYRPPRVLFPPRQLLTKMRPLRLPSCPLCSFLLPSVSPTTLLASPTCSGLVLVVRRHHPCHAPHFSHWPLCLPVLQAVHLF